MVILMYQIMSPLEHKIIYQNHCGRPLVRHWGLLLALSLSRVLAPVGGLIRTPVRATALHFSLINSLEPSLICLPLATCLLLMTHHHILRYPDADHRRQHRGGAITDKGQRQARYGQHPQVHADVDDELE